MPIKQFALFYGNPTFKLCFNSSIFNQHVRIIMFSSMLNFLHYLSPSCDPSAFGLGHANWQARQCKEEIRKLKKNHKWKKKQNPNLIVKSLALSSIIYLQVESGWFIFTCRKQEQRNNKEETTECLSISLSGVIVCLRF